MCFLLCMCEYVQMCVIVHTSRSGASCIGLLLCLHIYIGSRKPINVTRLMHPTPLPAEHLCPFTHRAAEHLTQSFSRQCHIVQMLFSQTRGLQYEALKFRACDYVVKAHTAVSLSEGRWARDWDEWGHSLHLKLIAVIDLWLMWALTSQFSVSVQCPHVADPCYES